MIELRPPSPSWKVAEPTRAFGYVSFFFGGHVLEDHGLLHPLAAWTSGERGVIAVYRRVDPASGTAEQVTASGPDVTAPKKSLASPRLAP